MKTRKIRPGTIVRINYEEGGLGGCPPPRLGVKIKSGWDASGLYEEIAIPTENPAGLDFLKVQPGQVEVVGVLEIPWLPGLERIAKIALVTAKIAGSLEMKGRIVVWSDLVEFESRRPAFRFALVRTDPDRLYVTGTTRTREEAERDLAAFHLKFPSSDLDLRIVDRNEDPRFAEAIIVDKCRESLAVVERIL